VAAKPTLPEQLTPFLSGRILMAMLRLPGL